MYLEQRASDRPVKPPSVHAKENIAAQISGGQCSMGKDGYMVMAEYEDAGTAAIDMTLPLILTYKYVLARDGYRIRNHKSDPVRVGTA